MVGALPFHQQLGQMRMVRSSVASAGQLHHVSHLGLRRGVGRSAATIPVGECGGTLLPIGRQNTPHVAFAHSQDLGRLTYRHLICQNAVEHLKSRLLLLRQCQSFHGMTFSLTS